jgi:DNA-binding NarL/FixJ family response regulator
MIVCIIFSLLTIGVLSLLQGYKPARYFLLANVVPLLTMIVLSVFLILKNTNLQGISLLPSTALLTQTVAFAIALVARVNLIKDELKEKQIQAEIVEKENDKILARNRYIELENEQIISDIAKEVNQKAKLQQKLESNQRELTANTLYLYQKNEMLETLQKQIQRLSFKDTTEQNRASIKDIKATLKNDTYLENDWDKFKLHFEAVHPNYFTELKEKYPTLTSNEIRLSAYYHLNMTNKEIATMLNINLTSVYKAKARLNKKMKEIDAQKDKI